MFGVSCALQISLTLQSTMTYTGRFLAKSLLASKLQCASRLIVIWVQLSDHSIAIADDSIHWDSSDSIAAAAMLPAAGEFNTAAVRFKALAEVLSTVSCPCYVPSALTVCALVVA